jgi:hypothetical protein
MILLDTYQGSEVDIHLTKFADLAQGQNLPMNCRDIDSEQDWLMQAESAVSQQAYDQACAHPLMKPPRISSIFGETEQGLYFKNNLCTLLNSDQVYTSAYTPYGFMGWHTDYDVAGWYIMFSLNEGPGSKFYWVKDNQVQVLEEPQGWTIKAGEIPDRAPYFWHAALSTTPKWTVIMFWDNEQAWQRACDVVTAKSSLDPVPGLILYGIFE